MIPLAKQRGYQLKVIRREDRPFDVHANVLDSTALRRQTGWTPKIELNEGFESTLDWQIVRSNKEP
jgi:nucleoside-diphosphate-sugar epimerase